jgi:hypothetical protein
MTMTKDVYIDFDGPIHRYSQGYADGTIYDPPTDYVKEVIDILRKRYRIVIFTARISNEFAKEAHKTQEELKIEIADWLHTNDIYFDEISCEKGPAIAYIDDLAIHFDNWKETLIALEPVIEEN